MIMKNIFHAKIVGLLALTFLLAAACNSQVVQMTPPTQTPPPPATPVLQTYRYQPYGFEFKYPADWVFNDPSGYANLQDKIVQVELSKDAYPKTNFDDAAFTVSAQFAPTLAACLAFPANATGNAGFKATQVINGIIFYTAQGNGAGAGNFYESHDFRTLHGGICIEIDETLHTSNIANFDPGTVTEVNHDQIFQRLDQLLMTFKFN